MIRQIISELLIDLETGVKERNHPFRYFTLATLDENLLIQQRTVVLRDVRNDDSIYFFTDKRSAKHKHLSIHPQVSVMFYDDSTLVQLRGQGNASICTHTEAWVERVTDKSIIDYTTTEAPGSIIKDPSLIKHQDDLLNEHFVAYEIKLHTLEYLRLKRPNHIRIRYERKANDWKGVFLVP